MQKLRGSPHIIVLLFYFLCLWSQVTGFCPIYQCECNDDDLRVICDNANLHVVPITFNPELKELKLSNNRISAIRSSLNVYLNLEYLDLSFNVIDILEKGDFNKTNHLKLLYLNNNNISILGEETFLGLNSLEKLYMYKNNLANLSSEIFMHLYNLEVLDVSQNQISFIDDKAFFGLKSLKILLLQNNELSSIPSISFQHISGVYNLDLSLNFFESIPENSFASLTELQNLSLGSCGIHVIMQGAFKWLNSLLVLYIHNNELNEIPTKALFDVIHLEELHLGQNKFFDIKPKSFQRLKNLSTINISDCQNLESLRNNVFFDNPNIKTIIMDHNKAFKHIEDGAFDNLSHIKHVSLRGNAFNTFQYNFLPWAELVSFDLRDNPLVCNCSLLWLWKLLVTQNYSSVDSGSGTSQVVCTNPPELKNAFLSNLLEVELGCYTLDARRQVIIGIILGGAVASAVIVMVGFQYRDKLAGVLKTKWGHGRKEPQYQTCVEEESTILQAAHQSLKMTPVTEL